MCPDAAAFRSNQFTVEMGSNITQTEAGGSKLTDHSDRFLFVSIDNKLSVLKIKTKWNLVRGA
jgi:hypothetical protein